MSSKNDDVIDFDSVEAMAETEYEIEPEVVNEESDVDGYDFDADDETDDAENLELSDSFEAEESSDSKASSLEIEEEGDPPIKQDKNWFKENIVLLLIVGLVLPGAAWFVYSIINPPAPVKNELPTRQVDEPLMNGSSFGTAQPVNTMQPIRPADSTVNQKESLPQQTVNDVPATIVQGVTEEDVVETIEPLVLQLNKLSESVNGINEYLNERASVEATAASKISEENLSEIKDAINAGLDNTEQYLLNEIAKVTAEVSTLSQRVGAIESKRNLIAQRKPLTMITASDGIAKLKVTGTDNVFTISNGEKIKGYGVISKVGPWGCLHLSTGEKFQPDNASCEEY